MKHLIFNKFFLAIVMILGIISCDDRELVTTENTAAPITMDLSAEKLFLDQHYPDNPALTVTWSPAQYTVPVEIKYVVEASADDKFETPFVMAQLSGSERSSAFTTSQVNAAAIGVGLKADLAQKLYIRVKAHLGSNSLIATSNVTSLTVTPYIVIKTYPKFYIVGAASAVGWVDTSAFQLYQVENKNYIYTYLKNGENFRFLGQRLWDGVNYAIDKDGTKDGNRYFKTVSENIIQAPGDDENMRFVGESGMYKITIDSSEGVHSLKAEASPVAGFDFPNMYIVGSVGGNGWDDKNPLPMTALGDGKYELAVAIADGDAFKFIGQNDWGDLDWGNILGEEGNTGYIAPKGNNSNIKFTGEAGTYLVTLDLKLGSYKIVKQ